MRGKMGVQFAAAIAALAGAHSWGASPVVANPGWAPKVTALYKLKLAGFELGTFTFTSSVTGDVYTLTGHSKMTFGLGLIKYTGLFTGGGRLAGDNVIPASYAYDWQANSKSGKVRIGYTGRDVKSVDIQPPHEPGPDVAPLRPEHMKGVFDPLTSLAVLSRLRAGEPCRRTIGVFEGKQRFDVVFSPLREERVAEAKPSGQPVAAHVCRVKYTPVGGHRMNRETQAAIRSEGIEVALRPVPSAGLLVPYRIVMPTALGNAVLTAQQVDITAPGNRTIALMH